MNGPSKWPQYIAAFSASGAPLANGIVLGWTSLTATKIQNGHYGFLISDEKFSWIGSLMCLGAALMCAPILCMLHIIGRKLSMLLMLLPFSVGWALLIWAKSLEMLCMARFVLGVSCGGLYVSSAIYTCEIAFNKDVRDILCTFAHVMTTVGMLMSIGLAARLNLFWMNIICVSVPLLFAIPLIFMPESPVFLVNKGNFETAAKSIKWLRGSEYNALAEIEEIKTAAANANISKTSSAKSPAEKQIRYEHRKFIFISFTLTAIQQLCGYLAIIFYIGELLTDAKLRFDPWVGAIFIAIMQVLAARTSKEICYRFDQRSILQIGGFFLTFALIVIGIYFHLQRKSHKAVLDVVWLPVPCICIFVVIFAVTYGPLPWLVMGQLLETDPSGFNTTILAILNWILAFIVTKSFTNLRDSIGSPETFWMFATFSGFGVLLVNSCIPETNEKILHKM